MTIVADISEARLKFVRETMGVPDTLQIRGDESDLKALAGLTNNQMADVVIDATGSNKAQVKAGEARPVAFAVWSGAKGQRGARKQYAQWVPMEMEVAK